MKKRIISILCAIFMVANMIPAGAFASEPDAGYLDMEPVLDEIDYSNPAAEDTGRSDEHPVEYIDIAPDIGNDSNAQDQEGLLIPGYLVRNNSGTVIVYEDAELTTVLCKLTDELIVLYADLEENGIVRVWFATAENDSVCGYVVLDSEDLLMRFNEIEEMCADKEKASASIEGKTVVLFHASPLANAETEEPSDTTPDLPEEGVSDQVDETISDEQSQDDNGIVDSTDGTIQEETETSDNDPAEEQSPSNKDNDINDGTDSINEEEASASDNEEKDLPNNSALSDQTDDEDMTNNTDPVQDNGSEEPVEPSDGENNNEEEADPDNIVPEENETIVPDVAQEPETNEDISSENDIIATDDSSDEEQQEEEQNNDEPAPVEGSSTDKQEDVNPDDPEDESDESDESNDNSETSIQEESDIESEGTPEQEEEPNEPDQEAPEGTLTEEGSNAEDSDTDNEDTSGGKTDFGTETPDEPQYVPEETQGDLLTDNNTTDEDHQDDLEEEEQTEDILKENASDDSVNEEVDKAESEEKSEQEEKPEDPVDSDKQADDEKKSDEDSPSRGEVSESEEKGEEESGEKSRSVPEDTQNEEGEETPGDGSEDEGDQDGEGFLEEIPYEYSSDSLTVTATAAEGSLPEDAELVVVPVANEETRAAYIAEIAEADGVDAESVSVRVFDIHFECEGAEVGIADESPAVQFNMTFSEPILLAENHIAPFYHAEGASLTKLSDNTADDTGAVSSIVFTTTSCSDFILADIEVPEEPEPERNYTYTGNGLSIFATVDPIDAIPETAELTVSIVSASEDRVQEYIANIASAFGVPESSVSPTVYDIHFEDEGAEIEVQADTIHFEVSLDNSIAVRENHTFPFYHSENGVLVEVIAAAEADGYVSSLSFDVSSCSDFLLADVDTTEYDLENKYAMLYANGDLVFQMGNIPDTTKGALVESWTGFDNGQTHPWTGNQKTKIYKIIFDTDVKTVNATSYFEGLSRLTTIENLERLDTSTVRSFSKMFSGCQSLASVDVDALNMDMAVTLSYMFQGCASIRSLDFSEKDFSKVTSVEYFCENCYSLETLVVAGSGLGQTNRLSLRNFACYSAIRELDLSGVKFSILWGLVTNCKNVEYVNMSNTVCSAAADWDSAFSGCEKLAVLDWTGARVTPGYFGSEFYNTKALGRLDLSGFNFSSTGSYNNVFAGSGIQEIVLPASFRFYSTGWKLPAGNWERVSTGEIYTADELYSAWNSSMADAYRRRTVITFEPVGGTVSPKKLLYTEEDGLGTLPQPELTGYTFEGWFTSPEGGTQLNEGDVPTQIVYYAHWKENEYTLILKRNVEDDPNDTETRVQLTYSQIYQLSDDIFEDEDKVIQGWTTNADGSGTFYSADEKVSWLTSVDGGEFHLYAKWGRTHNATISFDSQGGSDVDPVVIERGQTFQKEKFLASKKDSYTFNGWWTDPEEGTRWDTSDHVITESVQLYAHWLRNPVINFVPNGGWISTFSEEVPYGGSLVSLPWGEDRITKLMGFFTEQEAGAGEMLTTSDTFTEDATYYAHWGYQPTFNLAGGKYDAPFSVNTVYPIREDNMMEITVFPEVSFDGYELDGWQLGDGTRVEIGDIIDLSVCPEIIAVWIHPNTVKVTFDANGGQLQEYSWTNSSTSAVLSKVYEMEKDTPLGYYPDAYRYTNSKRFDFLGWYDADDNLYTRDSIISEDITLYAKYKATTNIQYKFIVKGEGSLSNYRATGDSYGSSGYDRVTTIYKNPGDEIGMLPGLEALNGATLRGKYLEGWYSDPEPYEEDGVTLKEGVEKLTPETVKEANSTWYAYIVNNVVDKYNEITAYKYYAEWTNASNTDLTNLNNNLEFHPRGYNDQTATMHIHFELNSQVSETLPEGSVRITVPKYIWKDWDGNNVGSVNLSSQLPQYPKKQSGMFFSYAEDEDGNYVMLNNAPISGGAGVDLSLSYTVDPVKVPGGVVDRNRDYVEGYEFYSGEVPVVFTIDADAETTYEERGSTVVLTNEYTPDTTETITLKNEMHTYVDPGITKAATKLYYEWQKDWGTRPDDAGDYFYMYWTITSNTFNNQPYELMLTEDTIHDGSIVYISRDYTTNPYRRPQSERGNSTYNYLYVVTRHPKTLLDPIPATGLLLENQARLVANWKSGYVTELVAPASYTMYKWEYTIGEFDKTNMPGAFVSNYGDNGYRKQSSSVQTVSNGQDKILNGQDINLEWELHYEGVSADTPILWDEESQTYSRLQRVIAIADGINNDLMYSSGETTAKYVWEPTTGNAVLSDNDYTIKKLRIFVNEYDGTYHNSQWGGPTLRSDYGLWKDIDIYVRYRNSSNLVYYKSVRPWATNKVNVGYSNQYGYTDVTLPPDVVGWEVRYPTKYFSTYLQVNMLTTLHATTDVKSYVQNDVLAGCFSEFKNRGYCNIWTSDNAMENPDTWDIRYMTSNFTEDTWEAPEIFFHVTDWTGGLNGANKEIWELTKAQGTMYTRKYTAGHERVLFDVERGVQENPMVITGWNYNSAALMPIESGRFYDLLPRGATVDRNTIFATLGQYNGTSNPYGSSPADNYQTARANTSSHLSKEYYNVQLVENWENSGRTMMIIDFTCPTKNKNLATFYYLLRMTYQDVVSYGTSVQNDVAFIDTTPANKYSYAYSAQSALGPDAHLYDTVGITNDYVAYNASPSDYIPVDAYSWGFYKSVNTQNGYVFSDITIPNNIYTYKINYAQSDYAAVHSMVFFDVLERGAYTNVTSDESALEKESEWEGTFESIDITPLKSLLKYGYTAENPVYCAPVVYYSTKDKALFNGSDWYVDNTETWTTVMPAKSDITAIAVDCTKASDGTSFYMVGRESAVFYINMRSSCDPEDVDKTTVNQALFKGNINDEPSESTSDTEVTLTEEEPEIHKTSDPESGTEEAPTVMSAGDNLTYTITVKNMNTQFTVPDIVVEDVMPDGVQVTTSAIKVHFGVPGNSLLVSNSPRVSMTVQGKKLIFNINSLEPEETCYIIVPCKAKAAGSEIIENTAVITEVNGIDKEINSETTYHKVEFDIIFSKQSDVKKLVIGATLQLWEKVEVEGEPTEVLVEEWVTASANKKIRLHTGSYVLKEIEVPDGYALADDIVFDILNDGTVRFEGGEEDTKVVMVDVASTTVTGVKLWKYDEEEDRPASVTVRLMRKTENDDAPVYSGRSITTSAEDNWSYDFGLVPKYDNEGNEYEYSVEEEPVEGYTPHYTQGVATNALELTFSNRTQTYDSNDTFTIYYPFGDKLFGKTYYGSTENANNPAGTTIVIPATEFYVAFKTDGANNAYGLKFDQIVPVHLDELSPNMPRYYPPTWISSATVENYTGGKYPETDHNYFVYEQVLMHYTRDMEGSLLDVINVKDSTGFEIPISKINEDNELIGGVTMSLTSNPEAGDAVIEPIEWVTVEGEPYIVHLFPGHYVLHESAPAAGYQIAEDIEFVVNGEGKVEIGENELDSIEMLDKYAINDYPFRKVWMDAGFESQRPASVTFNLVRDSDDEIVQTATLTPENATDETVWEGVFEDVPIIDEEWNTISYHVVEVLDDNSYKPLYGVQNRTGLLVTFSEDSDIGTGKMWLYGYGVPDSDEPHHYGAKNAVVLNGQYGMLFAEGRDMAGKTYYIPSQDGVTGFCVFREWADDFVKLEITDVRPTSQILPCQIDERTASVAGAPVYTGKDYPDLGETGTSSAVYVWNDAENGDIDSVIYDEIANYVNLTNIPFTKYWDNEEDENGRPETLTFSLYNILDMDTPVSTITVPVQSGATAEYSFDNVPKYNADWTLTEYAIREETVDGYQTFVSPDTIRGFLITFSEDSDIGNNGGRLYAYGKTDTNISSSYVLIDYRNYSNYNYFYGSELAGNTYYVPVVDPEHPGFALLLTDSTKTAHFRITSIVPVGYTKSNLNYSDGMPVNLINAFYENEEYPEADMSEITRTAWYMAYDYTGASKYVHNVKDETRIPVTKIWAGDDADSRPESITINAYNVNDPDTVVGSVVLTADNATAEDQWEGWITGLPKYNSDQSVAEYTIKEEPVANYFARYEKPKGMLVKFTDDSFAGTNGSTSGITFYTVSKKTNQRLTYVYWPGYNSYNYGNSISGKTFYIPVMEEGCYAFGLYKDSANSHIVIESVTLTTQEQEHYYSSSSGTISSSDFWYHGTGSLDLTGKSGYIYYDYTGLTDQIATAGSSFDNVVTNEWDRINVPFVKKWIDTGYESDRPQTVVFTLYNERDMETPVDEITLNRSDAEDGNVWNGEFENLPKYNPDGTEIVYVVREEDPGDYTQYDSLQGIKGFLLKFSEDTDLENAYLYIYQSDGYVARNYVYASESGYGNYYWSGYYNTTPAGKTVFVPVLEDGVYEFMVYLYRNSTTSYPHYTIESITPVYEELPAYTYSSGTIYRDTSYPYYELYEDVSSLSRDFSGSNVSNSYYLYTWIRWNIDDTEEHGLINRKNLHFVRFNKYGVDYDYVPGATLQIIKASDNTVITEWESNVYDYEFGLAAGEYILHEVEPPVGFAPAEDISFTVEEDGTVKIEGETVDRVSMKDDELVDVRGEKAWLNDNEAQRPENIVVNLYRDGEQIDSATVTAEDEWKYEFTGLPKHNENGQLYVYTVSEEPVYDYAETDLETTNNESWLSTNEDWDVPSVSVEHITGTYEMTAHAYEITLSSNSNTESTSYDYFYVYYRKNGQLYKLSSGQGSSNGGRFGGSLSNKKIYVPSNDIYFVWRSDGSVRYWGWKVVNMQPLATVPSNVSIYSETVTSLPTVDGSYSFGAPLEYSGTNYPETVHNYTTNDSYGYGYANNERKIYHWTGDATVIAEVDNYTLSAANGLKIKFDKYSQTESIYDKLEFYAYANGKWYKLPDSLSGDIRGAEVLIPSRLFYIKWTSNSYTTRNGWKIESITDYENVTVEALNPATDLTGLTPISYTGDHYPERRDYGNNESILYQYVADGVVLPDPDDRYGSEVVANITNERLSDKQEYAIYKQDPDHENVEGAVLEITGHEDRATYDIVPITWTSSADGPEIVMLRSGHYIMREVTPPEGYLKAADVAFDINENGEIIIGGEVEEAVIMTDTPNKQSIPVSKAWDDDGYSQYRPEKIIFDLYDVNDPETVVSTLELTADDNWAGAFTDIPYVYADGETPIEYTVIERDIAHFDEEILTDMQVLDGGISEYSAVRNFVYTPNYGIKINMSAQAGGPGSAGPLLVIWKDRMTGKWFSTGYGFGSNTVVYLSATEVYMLYRHYSSSYSYAGIDINSVEPAVNCSSWSLTGGYEWNDADINDVLPKAIARYQGSSTYYPTTLTSADFTDGTNGYHNSIADRNGSTEEVYQFVRVVRPSSPSVVTNTPSLAEIEAAEGFRVTLGDDYGNVYGPMTLVWKDEDGVYRNSYVSATSFGDHSFTVKSKEFYLFYVEGRYQTEVVDGNSYSIYGTGHSVYSVEAVSNVSWNFNKGGNAYGTESYADAANGYSTYFADHVLVDGRNGASLRDPRTVQAYSFIYENELPWYTYNDYYAEHEGFVTDPVTAKNTFILQQYTVPFAKLDEQQNMLAGAHLKLFANGEEDPISEWDTSATESHSETLWPGDYILKETSLPEGYLQSDDIAFTLTPIGEIVVGGTHVTSVNMTDVIIKGNITISKYRDAEFSGGTPRPLSGAVVELRKAGTTDVVATGTTNADGEIEWTNIPYGTYDIYEAQPPTGYQAIASPIATNVSITTNGQEITQDIFNQPVYGNITVTKARSDDAEEKLNGIVFELLESDKETKAKNVYGTVFQNVTTGAGDWDDGVAGWTNVEYGTYYIHEVSTIDGFVLDPDAENAYVEAVINEQDATVEKTIQVTNIAQTWSISVHKYDTITNDDLSGAVFTITRTAGLDFGNEDRQQEWTITTEADGTASLDGLTAGTYSIVETTPPTHYGQTGELYSGTITLSTNDRTTAEFTYPVIEVGNVPNFGKISVTKTNSLNQNPMQGVQFNIYQYVNDEDPYEKTEDKEYVTTITTDETGVAVSGDLVMGLYYVQEKEVPEGYQAVVKSADEVRVEPDETTNIDIANTPIRGRIVVDKKDILTNEPLGNAVFEITRTAGIPGQNDEIGLVETITTNAQGHAESGLLTYGTYEVKEVEAPEHYFAPVFAETDASAFRQNYPLDQVYTVEIHTDDKTEEIKYTYGVSNVPSPGWIDLYKADGLNNEPMQGAVFNVYRYDNGTNIYNETAEFDGIEDDPDAVLEGKTPVATITTDENGYAKTEELVKGLYVVIEAQDTTDHVPEGYRKDSRKVYTNVKVVSDETTHLTTQDKPAKNRPIEGKIIIDKDDIVTHEMLAGCVFQIERVFGIPGRNDYIGVLPEEYNMVTDANGHAESKMLTYGVYKVKEISSPAVYFDTVFDENDASEFRKRYPLDYVITVTIDQDNATEEKTYEYTYTNVPKPGAIELVKHDELNKSPIAGIRFEVFRYNNGTDIYAQTGELESIGIITTDSSGYARMDDLVKGLYCVKELPYAEGQLSPKLGYENELLVINNIKVYPNRATNLGYMDTSLTNTPILGRIVIDKTDVLTGEPLEGIEFKISRISGIPGRIDYVGEVERMFTDANGHAESSLLTYGVYEVTEVSKEGGPKVHYMNPVYNEGEASDYRSQYPLDSVIRVNINQSNEIDKENEINNGSVVYIKYSYKTAEYSYEVQNVPNPGKIMVVKTDSVSGTAMPGVKFDIYRYDNGQNIWDTAEDKTYVCTITTNAEGTAVSGDLPKGLYYVKEQSAPTGYVENLLEFENVAVRSDETATCTGTNTPVLGKISIAKYGEQLISFTDTTDELTGLDLHEPCYGNRLLPGTTFNVYAAEEIKDAQGDHVYDKDELVDTITTSAQGNDTTIDLPLGKYYLVEESAPEGFIKADEAVPVELEYVDQYTPVVIGEKELNNSYFTVQISLEKIAQILRKTSEGNVISQEFDTIPGENAIFGLYNAEDLEALEGSLEKDSLIATGKTNAEGIITISGMLPPGAYYMKEISAPAGWKLNEESYAIRIDPSDAENGIITIEAASDPVLNELICGSVKIVKMDDVENHPVAGALMEIRDESNEVVWKDTTDENGEIRNIILVPGEYTVTEIAAPYGYVLNTEPIPFALDGTETAEVIVTITNKPVRGQITVHKDGESLIVTKAQNVDQNEVDAPVFGYAPLAGTVFEVVATEDIKDNAGNILHEKGSVVGTITTDENGNAELGDLPLGKYHVVEKSAPDGYIRTTEAISIDLVYADQDTPVVSESIEVKNPFMHTSISLRKEKQIQKIEEHEDGTITIETEAVPGEGFAFGLYNTEAITGVDCEIKKDTLIAYGVTDKYGNVEFAGQFPIGKYYVKELKAADGWMLSDERYEVVLDPAKAVDNVISVSVKDEPIVNDLVRYPVTIAKVSETTEPLHDALLEVRDAEGNVVRRGYSDKNGCITMDLIPGKYTVTELLAPEGYSKNAKIYAFEIKTDGTVSGETQITDEVNRIQIVKTDANTHEPIEGAVFALIDKDQKAIMTSVTGEDGIARFECIPYGEYTIKEVKAAEGYVLNSPATVCKLTVDGSFVNNPDIDAEITNEENYFRFLKTDQDGKPLSGAVFGLYSAENTRLQEAVSDENGLIEFRRVKDGTYKVKEVAPPSDKYMKSYDEYVLIVDARTSVTEKALHTFVNKEKVLQLVKVDTKGNYIEGAEFSLIDVSRHEVAQVCVTDKFGQCTFTKFDVGDWIIRETKAPEGYNVVSDVSVHVGFDWQNPGIIKCIDIPDHYEFAKKDTAGNPLAGAEFTVTSLTGEIIGVFTSDINGIVHVTGLKPGVYRIAETKAPDGYLLSEDVITVEVDETYYIRDEMKTIVNIPNHYEFMKMDNNGNPMQGVKFTLENAEGVLLGEYVSGADGVVRITDLQKGRYVIRETQTLEGYVKTEEVIVVEIDENYTLQNEMFRMINYPVIKTGTEIKKPYLWYGVGMFVIALAAGVVLVVKKRKKE